MLIDYLLKQKNIPGAAKITTIVVQQEMFDSELLNYLSLYALAKFLELPPEERVFNEKVHKKYVPIDEDEINEEEIRTMKFPYLKNPFFDDHFDIEETESLIGKSIQWLLREVEKSADETLKKGFRILGFVYRNELENLDKILKTEDNVKINDSVSKAVVSTLQQSIEKIPEEGREENEEFKKLSGFIVSFSFI